MLLVALASIGMGTAMTALAQSNTETTSPTPAAPASSHHQASAHGHEMGAGPHSILVGTTLKATHHLNLTADQKSQIKTILHNAHEQERAQGAAPDMAVLGDPTNPGYNAALQSLKTNAAGHIQQESDVQSQIVNVLTPEQKAKLPTVLASMKAKHEAHRTASAEHKSPSSQR
jgi:Spy/CpxP family protein refolding chaperone